MPEKVSIRIPYLIFILDALPEPEYTSSGSSTTTGNYYNQQNVYQIFNASTRRTFFSGDSRVFVATTGILGGACAIGSAFWIAADTSANTLASTVLTDNQNIITTLRVQRRNR